MGAIHTVVRVLPSLVTQFRMTILLPSAVLLPFAVDTMSSSASGLYSTKSANEFVKWSDAPESRSQVACFAVLLCTRTALPLSLLVMNAFTVPSVRATLLHTDSI